MIDVRENKCVCLYHSDKIKSSSDGFMLVIGDAVAGGIQ